MVTGATNPSQLLLRWDGSVVQWGGMHLGEDSEQVWEFGSREIRKQSMLSEVVRFLHTRFKNVDRVAFTKRYSETTVLPSVLVEGGSGAVDQWFNLHNSPQEEIKTRAYHLDSVATDPVVIEAIDVAWEEAVLDSFPQSNNVVLAGAMLKGAVSLSRKAPGKWVVYVDAGEKGADIVAAKDGVPRYTGPTPSGLTDSMLYNIVNAMHRDGLMPVDVCVRIFGERCEDLVESMKRFFRDVEVLGGEDCKWFGLKAISE